MSALYNVVDAFFVGQLGGSQMAAVSLFAPIATAMLGLALLFGHDPADEHEVYTGEEIQLLIDESTERGLIDPEQNEFVDNIFDLGDKDAEGIMTPRTDVVCLNL